MSQYVWPLPSAGTITSKFGYRTDPITGAANSGHKGLDIGISQGTNILATRPGKVIGSAKSGYNGGMGLYVKIDHGNGMTSTYMHCSQVLVSTGDQVTAGQTIAKVGSTGRSTGPHLHFQLEENGKPVDPTKYVSSNDTTYTGTGGTAQNVSTSGGNVITGGKIYATQYTRADGIIREFAYLDDKNTVSVKKSKKRISIINYTDMLQQLSDQFGLLTGSYGGDGSGSYDTSSLTGNEKIFIDFLLSKGLNRAAACGAAGNVYYESSFNPAAVNSSSGASGLIQWLGSRKTQLIAKVPNWRTDIQGQLDFMWEELNSGYKAVVAYLQAAPDTEAGAESCAKYWNDHYEKPGGYDSRRGTKAKEYFRKIQSSGGTTVGGTGGPLKGRSGKSLSVVKTISIPSNVRSFLHSGDDCTCYSYWCHKLGWTQGKVAKVWIAKGKPHDSRNIGVLDGHLTIAMKGTFGNAGDLVRVTCEGGLSFTAVLVDIKGNDATSPYGHVKGGDVSPCEWYIWSPSSGNDVSSFKGIGDWRGKKVVKVENYGSWLNN